MSNRSFEKQLAEVDALRREPSSLVVAPLRKFLQNRNNYVVTKAAEAIREQALKELSPDLLIAFDRFLDDAVKTDPQCWAKNAIAKALAQFGHDDPEIFLKGLRHHQYEPVWGGQSDTAGTLRGTCALALVQCVGLNEAVLLSTLLEAFADTEKTVRAEAARAIAQVGSTSALLLLKERALIGVVGEDDAEMLGYCYAGILEIEGSAAIPFIARFLERSGGESAEAALALGQMRSAQAFEALHKRWKIEDDPWLRGVLLSAVALTRQEEALQLLLKLIEDDTRHAEDAIEALARAHLSPEVREQTRTAVLGTGNERLLRRFRESFQD